MALSEQQMKVLWSRSGDRCANCEHPLTADTESGKAIPVGQQAHIVARRDRGPRGDASTPTQERETATNHILLCGGCHDLIDKAPDDWPAERLRQLKTDHEARVRAYPVISELDGSIEVVARSSDIVEGVVVRNTPMRVKPGTRITVDAENAQQVTGLRVEKS